MSADAWPGTRTWVRACAAAETIGMTAASAAAVGAERLDPSTAPGRLLGLTVVVAGGVVEGVALGVLQARALGAILGRAGRVRWATATVTVAGVGWAAASAPAVLAGDAGSGDPPPWLLVLAGAAGLGLLLGAVLGVAQALAARSRLPHGFRWVSISALGWMPTMVVVFAGATAPSSSWPAVGVVALGVPTGLLAGSVLGAVTGPLLPCLAGPPPHNVLVLRLLRSPARGLLDGRVVGLRLGRLRSARAIELPVEYARDARGLVAVPGHADRKTWWRALRHRPDVDLLVDGRWRAARASVLGPQDEGYDEARASYARRFPRARLPAGQPLVRVQAVGTRPEPMAGGPRRRRPHPEVEVGGGPGPVRRGGRDLGP